MSAAEFGLHLAEYQRQPWGDLVVEIAGAQIATVLANIHRRQGTSAFALTDFMPLSGRQAREAEPEVRTDGESFREAVMARFH